MKVGIIGLGRMGGGIAANILRAGHEVLVWNRSAHAFAPLLDLGARAAADPIEALQGDVLISMLANENAYAAVGLNGPILARAAKSLVHVNTATVSIDHARRLAKSHGEAGISYIAAGVFGRADAAAVGKLTVVAAGANAAVDRARPILDALGRVFVVGESPEHANLVKLAGNLMLATVIESFGEAFTLVRKAGIDPRLFLDAITYDLFAAPAYTNYGRLIVEQAYEPPGFTLELGLKDLEITLAAGAELRVPLPLGSLARDSILAALAKGNAGKDWVSFADTAATRAGLDT